MIEKEIHGRRKREGDRKRLLNKSKFVRQRWVSYQSKRVTETEEETKGETDRDIELT